MSDKLNVLITGASSEIGFSIIEFLLEKKFQIVGQYYSNNKQLSQLHHPNLHLIKANLSDPLEAQKLIEQTTQQFEKIDALINMIGPYFEKDLLSTTPEEWKKVIDSNLNFAYNMSYYAYPHLIKSQGHILNFCYAGVENIRAWTNATAYAAAKSALAILTKSLAVSLAPHHVRVNAICPGYVESPHYDETTMKKLKQKIPQGKLCQPKEIISTVAWLLTESPAHLTGSFFTLSGGWEHD